MNFQNHHFRKYVCNVDQELQVKVICHQALEMMPLDPGQVEYEQVVVERILYIRRTAMYLVQNPWYSVWAKI